MPEKRMRLENSGVPVVFKQSLAGFFSCRVTFFSGQCVSFFLPVIIRCLFLFLFLFLFLLIQLQIISDSFFLLRATSLTGTGAVMLRTEPAALSLPGPSGSGFPSQAVATSTAGLLRPFRSRRPWRAVSCAFRTPAVRLPGCKAQRRFACRAPTLRRVPALIHFWCLFSV